MPDAGLERPWSVEPPWAGLTLDLTPDPSRDELAVEVRVAGERAAGITELSAARRWADTRCAEAIGSPEGRDGDGPLPLEAQVLNGATNLTDVDAGARSLNKSRTDVDATFNLGRVPKGGDLQVRYRVRSHGTASRFALRIGADRVSGIGHSFLLLPRIVTPIAVRIRWHLERLAPAPNLGAATSFGAGVEVFTTATSEDLAHAVYFAGPTQVEDPRPPSPTATLTSTAPAAAPCSSSSPTQVDAGSPDAAPAQRLIVLGAPAFDTRAAFYWSVTAYAGARRFFDPAPASQADEPFTFLLAAEPGLGRGHDGAALTRSFGLWFDSSRAFDAGLKSVIAHELVHRWIGGEVYLVDNLGREATWFSEGFTVHFARRFLLEARLVAPRDLLADLRRTTGDPSDAEATCVEEQIARSPDEYRRGARYAAILDRAIRRASHDSRSLDDLFRDILTEARTEHRHALPIAAFRALIVRELGEPAGADFDAWVGGSSPIALPSDAFGPCFRRQVSTWVVQPCPGFP